MSPRGLFVSYRPFLKGHGGGVQVCTEEYRRTIEAAGVGLSTLAFDADRRWPVRLLRQFDSSPYLLPAEPGLPRRIAAEFEREPFDYLFLNQVALAALAQRIKALLPPSVRIILLSHGSETTDLPHLIRLRESLPLSGRTRPWPAATLSRVLDAERRSRASVDGVVTLSATDAEVERGFGVRKVEWMPRSIVSERLDWRPRGDRFGFVGTLDHGPNLEGLVLVLEALERASATGFRVRVVGRPTRIGEWLARRHARVDFLGNLNDEDLKAEAATWSGFLHPIFCVARGCSTKLAAAIAWGIPIVTTPEGRRGYEWRAGGLLEASDADSFARAVLDLLDGARADAAHAGVLRVAETSPGIYEVGAKLRAFLDGFSEAAAGDMAARARIGNAECASA